MSDLNLRGRILKKAYEMFSSRGIKVVTMDAISAELSISKRTLYEEFSSKKELLENVLFEMSKYYQEQNNKISAMDISALEKIFLITTSNNERTNTEVLFFKDIVSNYPNLIDKLIISNYERNINRIRRNVIQGCEEGFFNSNIDLDLVLDFFFNLKLQLNYRVEINMVKKYSRYVLSTVFFLRSIATPKGIEEIDRLCEINNINIYKIV